ASATPSLESWANAQAGKYRRIDLTSRFGDAVMPDMRAIDMRDVKIAGNRWISPQLKAEVEARVASGEQALLFINRRGYAPVTICRACGHQIGCDHCDARMVEHRFQAEDRLAAVGPGVERLGEEASELFPDARIATLSSDMYGSARALKAEIEGIAAGAADIIIGTQLVAKGHNFPLLTLVGV
ncbi:MAG: primosomal protein N', partial [Halocynthiibacter sp.]